MGLCVLVGTFAGFERLIYAMKALLKGLTFTGCLDKIDSNWLPIPPTSVGSRVTKTSLEKVVFQKHIHDFLSNIMSSIKMKTDPEVCWSEEILEGSYSKTDLAQ